MPEPEPGGLDQGIASQAVAGLGDALKKRPYLAIVVARSGFDALVWLDNPKRPQQLDGILAGDRLLRPTNKSLGGWL